MSAPQDIHSGLTVQRLRELFHYDLKTGIFTRRVRTTNSVRVGEAAGSARDVSNFGRGNRGCTRKTT